MTGAVAATKDEILRILEGFLPRVGEVDLKDGLGASAALNLAHPLSSPEMKRLETLCRQAVSEGWLVPKPAGPDCRFGRLAKDFHGYAVDCVLMTGRALGHTHTRGEINIAIPWEGKDPRFDGWPAGWVVFPPGSHHVPTVTGGKMLFVYLLPGGEVKWDPAPKPS